MKVSYDYSGKVAVVTGSATGIGHAIAMEFAKAGADIAVCDYNEEKGKATVEEIKALGRKAAFFKCDVSKDEDVAAMKEGVMKEFGTIDFLLSNAGVSYGYKPDKTPCLGPPFTNVLVSDWERMFDINLFGMVRVIQAFYDVFAEKKEGKIVCTASIAAFESTSLQPQYNASKAGVINLVQSVSTDMGPYNVNVNAICPGFVYTPMYEHGAQGFKDLRPQFFADTNDPKSIMMKLAVNMSSLHRAQTPEDLANAALFLCSDAAKEITGQYVCVDSGIVTR
ncbi:MAG: SDR family oxidoreductase [Clostridia bacterium]|nr:SDR family oxidoreductase [Clostridia bacterium]